MFALKKQKEENIFFLLVQNIHKKKDAEFLKRSKCQTITMIKKTPLNHSRFDIKQNNSGTIKKLFPGQLIYLALPYSLNALRDSICSKYTKTYV